MSEIKYVCFDIGGVANVRPLSYLILSAAQKRWENFSEEAWKKMVQPSIDGKDIWREFQNGNINTEQYLDAAFRGVEVPATSENKLFFRSLLEDWCGVPYQPVLDLVERLKQNGYHTSVLSNNNEIMYNTFSAEAIKSRVDVAISSHEIGVSKPHWDAYCILLGKIGTDAPGEVVFVDDRRENADMATKLGLHGFHFKSREEGRDKALGDFVHYLRKNGVRI